MASTGRISSLSRKRAASVRQRSGTGLLQTATKSLSALNRIRFSSLGLTGELKLLLLTGGLFVITLAVENALLSPLRLILALLFVLFVPGYFLQAAIFPRDGELALLERLSLALGTSVAAIPPMALLLDYLPFTAISLTPIFVCEALYTLLAVLAAWLRRRRIHPTERFLIRISSDAGFWWQTQDRVNRLLYRIMGAAFLIAGIAALLLLIMPPSTQHLTEFYLLGGEGLAEDYPRVLSRDQSVQIEPVIVNGEDGPRHYFIQAFYDDQVIAESPVFALAAGELLSVPLTLDLSSLSDEQSIEIRLHQPPDLINYRRLNLWISPERTGMY